jgi:tripartite-type tricarboxylate transporter receptor subunit TctC
VAKSAPDGYTLLITGTTAFTVSTAIYGKKLQYSVLDDFEPLGLVYTSPNVFVIHPSVPAKTLHEFIDLVKKNPGKFNYASGGPGSFYHLGAEYFKIAAGGLNLVQIPYKGGQDSLVSTLSNEVQFSMNSITPTLPHIKQGTLRPLATTGQKRERALPDVPTMIESGFPGFVLTAHVAVVVPKKTPKERVELLRETFKKANSSKAILDFYENIGATRENVDPDEFIQYFKNDVEHLRKAAIQAGIYEGN